MVCVFSGIRAVVWREVYRAVLCRGRYNGGRYMAVLGQQVCRAVLWREVYRAVLRRQVYIGPFFANRYIGGRYEKAVLWREVYS